jgi:hypothetical protein
VVVDAEKKEAAERERENLFQAKERSVFKNSLTGPTLLEMSGLRVYQDLGSPLEVNRVVSCWRGAA